MPGTQCAVYGCKNSYSTKKATGRHIVFHVFPKPKDVKSKALRRVWISRCKREDKFNPDTNRICSEHFSDNDYERDLENELLNKPLRKLLKKTAIPTLGIFGQANKYKVKTSARSDRFYKRERNQELSDLLWAVSGENKTSNSCSRNSSKTESNACSRPKSGVNISALNDNSNMYSNSTMPECNVSNNNNSSIFVSKLDDIICITTADNFIEKSSVGSNYEMKYKELLSKYDSLLLKYNAIRHELEYYKSKNFEIQNCIKSEIEVDSNLLKKVIWVT